METIDHNTSPQSARVLEVTPDQLRLIADRLDQESRKVTQSGERVLYQMTAKITLLYTPSKEAK